MTSQSQNCTPSWKVNLTQKFNKISHKIDKNQGVCTFDDQLQQRLNFIPIQRQQLSTNKRKQLSTVQKSNKQKIRQINNDFQENIESKIEKLRFDSSEKDQESLDYFSLFTDQKVANLFTQYFRLNETIELKQFVEVCCQQLLNEQQCPPSYKEALIEQSRSLFCTTDDNLISLNAVQMLTKKEDLKLIILETLMNVKYQKRKENLQKHYEEILEHIVEQEENIKREEENIRIGEEKLEKKRAKIQMQQKQLKRKQVQLKGQQKELIEKEKQIKKVLEDKHNRLLEQFTSQCDKQMKEIQKKANGFERNARNKMELLEKRQKDFVKIGGGQRKLGEKEGNEQSMGSSHKQNNEVYLLRSKLRKAQKELQNIIGRKSKQWQVMQNESNSLLKANTVLQTKLQKSKEKVRQLSQILARTNHQLSNTHQQLMRKEQQLSIQLKRITQLEEELLQSEHINSTYINSNHINRQNQKHNKQPANSSNQSQCTKSHSVRGKAFTFRKQQMPPSAALQLQNPQQIQSFSFAVSIFNRLIQLLMEGFATYQHNYHSKVNSSSPIIKIQQTLLNQTQQILATCSNMVWPAIRHSITNISLILQFMIKLFLAKFSFLKFQSITNSNQPGQSYLNELEDFAQNISSNQFHKDKHMSIEEKLKASSLFISQYKLNQSSQERLNLYIVMLILGIDEIFNFTNNKTEPIIKHIFQLIADIDIQKMAQPQLNILSKFYDEELMAFLFWKYMSYSTSIHEVSIFMDILIEICNLQNLNHFNTTNPLFKAIHALENYKFLTNFLILNFTEKNLQKNNKQLRQTFEKVSIILQRFCYFLKGNLLIPEEDAKRLKKIMKQIRKNQQFNDSMFKANMKSILQAIFQNHEEQSQF